MMSIVPPFVAMTALMSWVLLTPAGGPEADTEGVILADNMVRYMETSISTLKPGGFPAGPHDITMPPPFVEMSNWSAEIIFPADSPKQMVIWPADYGSASQWSPRDYADILSVFDKRGFSLAEYGRWTPDAGGAGGAVGTTDLVDVVSLIPQGAPVLVRQLGR